MRTHRDAILDDWMGAARALGPAAQLSREQLIDSLPQLLDSVAEMVDELLAGAPRPDLPDDTAERHAVHRLDVGFDLPTVVAELALLRDTVARRWLQCASGEAPGAHRVLDQAIDRAIVDSVTQYTTTRERIVAALDAISQRALSAPDLDSLLHRLVRVVRDHTPAVDTAVILLREGDHLRVRAAVGLDEEEALAVTVPLGRGFAGTIVAERRPLELTSGSTDPRILSEILRSKGLKGLYGVPLVEGDEALGVVHVGSLTASTFSHGDQLLLDSVATRVTEAVRHHMLRETADERARELEESERRFRATFENAAVGIVHVNRAGQFLRVNQPYADLLGYAPEELVGRAFSEVTHPDHRFVNLDGVEAVFAGASDRYRTEKRYVRKDGSTVWAELTLSVVRDGGDEPAFGVAIVQNIDRRKREEEARHRSEATAQLATEVAGLGTWDWDIVTDELHWSEQTKRLYGLERDQPVAQSTWFARLAADERGPTDAAIQHALDPASGGAFHREQRICRASDGQPRLLAVRGQTFFDAGGRPIRMIGTAVDVTEERRSSQRVRFLSDASALLTRAAVAYVDALHQMASQAVPPIADWCLIDVTREPGAPPLALCHVNPYKEAVLRRMHQRYPNRFAVPRTGTRSVARSILAIATEERTFHEMAVDGDHLEMLRELGIGSYVTTPLVVDGQTIGVISLGDGESGRRFSDADALFLDELAGRIAAAVQNARLHEETQRSVAARERILGIVSHDLRNPLGVVDMGSSLLLETPSVAEDEAARRQVEAIHRSAKRMSRMIRDLLDMSSIQAGQLAIERERCELRPILDEALETHDARAREKGVVLECKLVGAGVTCVGDRDRLLQVLGNLLGNAIKFCDAGDRVLLCAEVEGPDVRVLVRDTGPGIPPDQLESIFDPYWHTKSPGGTGLGLFISKGIVEAHGGQIGVESKLGEGTSFWLTIPRSEADEDAPTHASPR